jgi:hypothetical protein
LDRSSLLGQNQDLVRVSGVWYCGVVSGFAEGATNWDMVVDERDFGYPSGELQVAVDSRGVA